MYINLKFKKTLKYKFYIDLFHRVGTTTVLVLKD